MAEIAASIREFGFTNPILVDGENGIIAGHGRLLAARQLGMKTVPVIELAGLSEAQKRAYIIADNKLALNAGWDNELLGLELGELKDLGFDLALTGFSEEELAGLLSIGTAGLTDPDEVPPLPEEPVSQEGDLWLLGSHRLLCGDSTKAEDVARVLDGVKPHLLVSDPPYGVDYQPDWRGRAGVNANTGKMGRVTNDDRADWREAWALFPGDVAYVWHAGRFASTVQASLEASGFEIRAQIIWAKDRFALSRGHYHYQHEPCWYACQGNGPLEGRPLAIDALEHSLARRPRPWAWNAEAGRMHAPADAQQFFPGPGGLRALLRLRHDDHRRRDDRPGLPCDRDQPRLCRCRRDALAGVYRQGSHARRGRAQLRRHRRRAAERRGKRSDARPSGGDRRFRRGRRAAVTTKAEVLHAIRQKCLDCSCHHPSEVRDCRLTACSLWPFRFGRDPEPSSRPRLRKTGRLHGGFARGRSSERYVTAPTPPFAKSSVYTRGSGARHALPAA